MVAVSKGVPPIVGIGIDMGDGSPGVSSSRSMS